MASNDSGSVPTFVFYHYNPSLGAAIFFIVLFGLSALLHIFQLIRARTWYFIPFVVGCLFEAIGYLGRALSANEAPNFTKNPYIIQSLLLLLGPALFAASIYMILARLIVLLDAESYSVIRTKWLTKVFVSGDVISFITQSTGGALMSISKNDKDYKLGEHVIVAGLGIQIVFFGFFMLVTLIFHRRVSAKPTRPSLYLTTPWKSLLYVLYISSIIILVRSAYRITEYIMGSDGILMSKEYYLYLLDAAQMGVVATSYNWFHPSRVINRAEKLDRVDSQEVVGASYAMHSPA